MKTGLTSVSFRSLSVDAVIELASRSGVDGIEWGSDVHVPETDVENARRVAHKTVDAGLSVISYGSYFYLGEGIDFTPYVDTAVAMNTKVIRIWGGKKERDELLLTYKEEIAREKAAKAAKAADKTAAEKKAAEDAKKAQSEKNAIDQAVNGKKKKTKSVENKGAADELKAEEEAQKSEEE